MSNQATALTTPAATELATTTKRKAAADVAVRRQKANTPSDGKVPTDEAIRLDTYLKWIAAGKPAGDGISFWLEAEQDLSNVP